MVIGIDGNEANIEKRVGVNQYGYELLWAIHKLQDEWKNRHEIIVFLSKNPLPDLPKQTKNFKYKVMVGEKMWIVKKLTPYLLSKKKKPDIFFSPSHYVPLFSRIPRICSIMDLGYMEFSTQFKKSQLWQLKLWTAYSIFVSKAIIAISNRTKADIVRHFPFASKRTHAIPLAYDDKRFNEKIPQSVVRRIRSKYSIVGDYILYLGTLKPSKNIEGIIDAFNSLKDENSDLKLVIVGKKGWLYQSIFEKVEKLGLKDDVLFTGYINEKDKPGLIKGAKVFVIPSFWEGFGLDVLNALACGIPVVVSDKGSLTEVVGEAGVYVNPYDSENIARGIKKVLSLKTLEYNKLVEEGLKQVKKYSWEKTARQTLKILESVGSKR